MSRILIFINLGYDGNKFTFVFNTSYAQEAILCPDGLQSIAAEMEEILAEGFETTLMEEMKTFSDVFVLFLFDV